MVTLYLLLKIYIWKPKDPSQQRPLKSALQTPRHTRSYFLPWITLYNSS